jgi:two-component system, cell cycle response regulator
LVLGLNSTMPRAVRLLLVAALAALLVHVARTVSGLGGGSADVAVDDWLYTFVLGACALTCIARGALAREERLAWILIGCGLAAWTAGDSYWAFHLSGRQAIEYPSIADAARLLLFPAAYAGIALLVRARVPRFDASLWLDGVIGALAVAAVGAAVLYPALEGATQGELEAVATHIGYPLGDLLLIGFVIGAVALTGWRPGRGLVLIACGLSVNAVANGIEVYRDATGGGVDHSAVDSLWLVSALVLALAAWVEPTRSGHLRLEGRRLLTIPSFFAAVAVALQVYGQFDPLNRFAAGFATATLGVVIVRMALLFADHLALLAVSRRESRSDPVTGLGNRRKLMLDLQDAIEGGEPHAFSLFDLDGFKAYNDSFGHPAGDALLRRLGENLAASVQPSGSAYRLGGDEFCVLTPIEGATGDGVVAVGSAALSEAGKAFSMSSSSGSVLLPQEADDPSQALLLADRRMYAAKRLRPHSAERQTRNVLLRILREREPDLDEHLRSVASLALLLARYAGVEGEELDVVARAAELHDVGKIAIPEQVLRKRGGLTAVERELIRTHTVIGERILASAPAMVPVARLVRSSHERWDGDGYPDRLGGEEIPLGARIIAVCDAFDAMVSKKPYRRSMESSEALAELRRCSGTQFDPELVELFCEHVQPQVGEWAVERYEWPLGGAAAPARSPVRRSPGTIE